MLVKGWTTRSASAAAPPPSPWSARGRRQPARRQEALQRRRRGRPPPHRPGGPDGGADKDAVPVLIGLLADLPADRVWEAEEMLAFLAGDKGAAVSVAGDADARKKARDAWAAWWADNNASIDLAKLDLNEKRELGYLLVVEIELPRQAGRPRRGTGRRRQARAGRSTTSTGPQDAQAVGGNRVRADRQQRPCASASARRPATRRSSGRRRAARPSACSAWPTATPSSPAATACWSLTAPARRCSTCSGPTMASSTPSGLRDGQIALLNNQGGYSRLDATGKEVKSFRVPFNINFGINGGEVLPNDHVLIVLVQHRQGLRVRRRRQDGDGGQRACRRTTSSACPTATRW